MRYTLAFLIAPILMTGCALDPNNHTLVVLQHPETKQTVQCKSSAGSNWNPYAQVEECAKAYEKAGFVRMGAY